MLDFEEKEINEIIDKDMIKARKVELAHVMHYAFTELLERPPRWEEIALGIGTVAVESAFVHRKQIAGGPARGLVQMEPATARDIFKNFLVTPERRELFCRVMFLWLRLRTVPSFTPRREELDLHLQENDAFAFAMMRVHYLRDPEPIPQTVGGQAAYWKRVYNTPAGAGTVEKYLQEWEAQDCTDLVIAAIGGLTYGPVETVVF